MFPRKRRRPTPCPRPRLFRPLLEGLENRLAPAGLAALAAAPSAAFDPLSGSLSITGAGGRAVQVASTAGGGLAVTVNGQLFSPAGASASGLRRDRVGRAPRPCPASPRPARWPCPPSPDDRRRRGRRVAVADDPGPPRRGSRRQPCRRLRHDLGRQFRQHGEGRAPTAARAGRSSITATDRYPQRRRWSAPPARPGQGSAVTVDFTDSYIDTAAAVTEADGAGGAGGQVTIDGGATGRLFSSGAFDATGATGGGIDLFGNSVALVAATADASGTAGAGGRIRVGGDYHGDNPDVPNAQAVDVSGATVLRADAGGGGAGGRITVWSESETTFDGSLSARPAGGGAGGFLEASSHGQLTYGGSADAGVGGTLLLDPQFLTVAAAAPFSQYSLVNPAATGTFGTSVLVLANGNIVVTDPNTNNFQGGFTSSSARPAPSSAPSRAARPATASRPPSRRSPTATSLSPPPPGTAASGPSPGPMARAASPASSSPPPATSARPQPTTSAAASPSWRSTATTSWTTRPGTTAPAPWSLPTRRAASAA